MFKTGLPAGFATRGPATATTAAAAAATTTAAKTIATAATAKTAGARLPGTGFVDRQGAAAEVGAIQRGHGVVGFRINRHFDEGESARLAGFAIFHNLHAFYLTVGGERLGEVLFIGFERDVTHVNILQNQTPDGKGMTPVCPSSVLQGAGLE
jgi:hypothetical protein